MVTRRNTSISRQVMLVNTVLAFILLGVFVTSFFFFNYASFRQDQEYSEKILRTVSRNVDQEVQRLTVLTKRCEMDRSILYATANKLGMSSFINDSIAVSEKLGILQFSLPYALNVYTYINSSRRVISQDRAVLSEEAFLAELGADLALGETLPDLSSIPESGFYSYHSFSMYISKVLDNGAIVIKLDGNKFCNLDMLFDTLPAMDFIVLNRSGAVFASSDPNKNPAAALVSSREESVQIVNYEGEQVEITQKLLPGSGFRLLLIRYADQLGQQHTVMYFITILAGLLVCVACSLSVYLNKRIYIPLAKISSRYKDPANQNEIDVIRNKIDELTKQNDEITEQLEVQRQIQLNLALNYALQAPDSMDGSLCGILQKQYNKFWILVVAAQDSEGSCGSFFEEADDYLFDSLAGRPIRIDPFCHAYIIPARKSIREGREALWAVVEKQPTDGVSCIAGISDFYDSISDLQEAFHQARNRMLSNPLNDDQRCAVCVSDAQPLEDTLKLLSLEVQNTVAGYILNGSETEIKNILQHILFSTPSLSLHNFISLYHALCSLIQIVIFSSGTSSLKTGINSLQPQPAYNPAYMYTCVLNDCLSLNEVCGKGQNTLRYQITDYLQEHYSEPLSLESIASEFGITPVYLSSWFKKNTGINLSVYLSNLRMEAAKKILAKNTGIKINELAAIVGIPNTPTFIRQFKNYTGTTPDQYRKMIPQE